MSNRVIFMAAVGRDQIALCDRNCHKSIEHSLVMTGAIPTYVVPLRNRYGIIGPIPPERLGKEAVDAAIKANPLAANIADTRPVHAIVTNSTYDGLCYDARRVEALLDPSVDRIHFDEAWYAYARFNPLYRHRHAMHGDPEGHKGPTVFATHSTHKLLAALSQASLLHVRDGRNPIPHARFNQSFMMHASTSPLYPIIVSNDITAAMMEGPGGLTLTNESILEAVAFRQTIGRVHRQFTERGEWFFRTWNADTVKDPKTGKTVRFEDAPADRLVLDPDCWELHPGEVWHRNAPLAEVMPSLANGYPGTYTSLGLRALADQMFAQLNETRQMHWLAEAFSTLPVPVMTPNAAYQHLVRDQIEHVPVDELADRVLATSIVPYPPGIPLLMPGEATGAAHGPYLSYLRALWSWDRRFPGFGHDTHGIEHRDGTHYVQCLKKDICSQIQSRRPSAS